MQEPLQTRQKALRWGRKVETSSRAMPQLQPLSDNLSKELAKLAIKCHSLGYVSGGSNGKKNHR